jgi:DNA-binding MarR family transcriptional regulator
MAERNHIEIRDGLRSLYVRSRRTLDRILAPYGSSAARLSLMTYIAKNGGVRSAEIIKAFTLAPRTVTEAIDALETAGHVQRRSDPVDGRAKVISLTPAGAKLFRKLEPLWERFAEELLDALSGEERRQFATLLGKLNGRLEEIYAELEEAAALEAP